MPKINPENHINVNRELVGGILDEYGIRSIAFGFEEIGDGIENTSLRIKSSGKEYVLRIYAQGHRTDGEIARELEFQNYLRSEGIPVPAVFWNKNGKDLTVIEFNNARWQVILMEFKEGESRNLHYAPELIADLARIHARMHELGIAFAKKKKGTKGKIISELREKEIAPRIPDVSGYGEKTGGFIRRVQLFRYPLHPDLPYGYNHMDIGIGGNVLVKDGKVSAIVDFDDMAYSPPVVCLGYTLWSVLCGEGAEAMWRYLEEYEKVRPLVLLERKALYRTVIFRNYDIGMITLFVTKQEGEMERIFALEKEIPQVFSAYDPERGK